MRSLLNGVLVATMLLVLNGGALAQPPGRRPPASSSGDGDKKKEKDTGEPPAALVNDAKFRLVYADFVSKAEKLADEFEKAKQHDKAKAVYEEILRLVPEYANAKKKLDDMRSQEATADKKVVIISALKEWQDTGVVVIAGKPVHITATGNWTFKLTRETNAEGIVIPKELRDFNLGALVGMVQTNDPKDAKPFFVGADKSFLAEKTGKLLLRMYDEDPRDNIGQLSVTVQGTFEKSKP